MTKTSVISARIDPELKNSAEIIFRELGLTATQAITMFYKQVELQQGLPFLVKIPNDITLGALREARSRYDLEELNTVDDLFDDLEI